MKEYKPHDPEPRQGLYGDEEHSCPCGGTIKVCRICNGDYHENEEEHKKCHLNK